MKLIAVIEESWGWTGLQPDRIVDDNEFGNLLIKDTSGRYWRLCPEDLSCKIVASSKEALDDLSQDQTFLDDWHMTQLVQQARERFGPLGLGFKYCLKIPGVLGGQYGGDNLATMSFSDLISASGHVARQVRDLPDGAQIKFSITG